MRKLISVLAVLAVGSLAGAQSIFDNINGFTAWSTSPQYWIVRGSSLSSPQTFAQQFTAGTSGTIGSIELSIQKVTGTLTQSGTVSVFADSGSNTMSNTALGSQAFATSPVWDSTSLLTLSAPNVAVTSGSKYWIRVTPDANSDLGWRINATFVTGWTAWQGNAASPPTYVTDKVAGMRITGAVPEPITCAVLGVGFLGFVRKRR